MRPLVGNETALLTAVNGIPYWYFYAHGGEWQDSIVESVDPDGAQWRTLGPDRAIGCVVYPATEVVEPGVIQHVYGNKLPIGEPDGTVSPRVQRIAEILSAAGFDAPIRERIRDEIWLKLWGNLCFNPISALTCGTLDVICGDPGTRAVARAMDIDPEIHAEKLSDRLCFEHPSGVSTARPASAPIRPRCSRTSSAVAPWRSTHCARRFKNSGSESACPLRRS
jgi:2-dehydropantoate 2-reductase